MANKLPSQLAVYFNDIPRDILNEMTNEELMHIVDKEDRVWMMLFLKNGGFKTMADDSDVMNEATGQILRLTSSVVSDRFKQYDPNSCLSNILQLRLGSEIPVVGLQSVRSHSRSWSSCAQTAPPLPCPYGFTRWKSVGHHFWLLCLVQRSHH
eukprot:TRINITY_DN9421_c0_g1_i2.p1 TRINITY_DN9421_c0_g1~~TRINITY_DN9421_c0_g1_i2.p1  ORF type:complete len:153 (+),score=9.99 TRINITY_DN9421_c0_g1_i2:148-606(+)